MTLFRRSNDDGHRRRSSDGFMTVITRMVVTLATTGIIAMVGMSIQLTSAITRLETVVMSIKEMMAEQNARIFKIEENRFTSRDAQRMQDKLEKMIDKHGDIHRSNQGRQ